MYGSNSSSRRCRNGFDSVVNAPNANMVVSSVFAAIENTTTTVTAGTCDRGESLTHIVNAVAVVVVVVVVVVLVVIVVIVAAVVVAAGSISLSDHHSSCQSCYMFLSLPLTCSTTRVTPTVTSGHGIIVSVHEIM